MIRALIFDFDGLLVDTELPAFQAWQEIYAEHGCRLSPEDWAACLGGSGEEFDPCADIERQLGRPIDRAAVLARRRARKAALVAGQPALPGVLAYLDAARRLGLKVGLASSSPRSWVADHLARLGLLDRFDCLKRADDVARVKPDPALFQAALAALGVRPEEAIVLEDSANGLLAAKRAGTVAVAVPNAVSGRLPLDHADLRLDSLADLPLEGLIAAVERRRISAPGGR